MLSKDDESWSISLLIDFVLLPYDYEFYNSSTSGIFVETIIAKKIPFVSDRTWMALECQRFGLSVLIIKDWSLINILEKIYLIKKSKLINAKLDKFVTYYSKFHSIKTFAKKLKSL